ncbi:ABC transporter substrate-binding protein [Halopenitus persicus]|nr:extracellular solute-binding protein [Halopenitus persicus]
MPREDNQWLSRRGIVKSSGALAATLSLAGCLGGGGSGDGAPDSLTFATWGGTWQDVCQKAALDPFAEETGIEINYMVGSESERFQRLVAQEDNPPFDAAQYPTEYLARGENEDMFYSLDSELIPVYDKVPDTFKSDSWLVHHFTASALVYNTNTFDSPPEDMGVYLDTDYKGRVALGEPTQRSPAFDLMAFSLYLTDGESYKEIDEAFEMYKEVVDTMDPKFPGATEQYGKLFANDEIDIGRIWAARSASWAADGTAIDYVLPPNGSMTYSAGHAIPKNISENKLSAVGDLIQAFYTSDASKTFANDMNYPTVNPDVEYSEEVQSNVPTMDDIDNLLMPDFEWVGSNRDDWTTRANEIIQG